MRALVLKIIPLSLKEPLKKWIAQLSISFVTLFSTNGFFASLYYFLFDRSFYREHKAALKGRIEFQRKLSDLAESSALLRRNIHRLEKGLIMQPRRDSFAENYILETVDVYHKAVCKNDFCQDEVLWGYDVLSKYFDVVKDVGRITQARARFAAIEKPQNADNGAQKSIPYDHQQLLTPGVDYEQLKDLFTRRRSVRWYQSKPVEPELLEQAVSAASLAPSACNRQPFYFSYTTDPQKATDIAKCAMGTVGFAENLVALIVVVGDLSNYPAERDRHVIYIDGSLAAMQLMLSLETLGLSTCPINWPDVEDREREIAEKMGLAYHERPIMLMAVGYAQPHGGVPFSQKKSVSLLLKEMK